MGSSEAVIDASIDVKYGVAVASKAQSRRLRTDIKLACSLLKVGICTDLSLRMLASHDMITHRMGKATGKDSIYG